MAGQAPTFAHDTITQGTGVTGLAGVFAETRSPDISRPSMASSSRRKWKVKFMVSNGRVLRGSGRREARDRSGRKFFASPEAED